MQRLLRIDLRDSRERAGGNKTGATSIDAADRNRRASAKFLTGFDLCNLSAGATDCFGHIGADTIQRVCCEYSLKRRAARRVRLAWRKSFGARRALGWIPFKAASLKRKGRGLRFCGKTFRVFESERLQEVRWCDGCFAQDAVGDWWLCLPAGIEVQEVPALREGVGIDLGLKDTAMTSAGERLAAGRFFRDIEAKIGQAQRRGHKRQAKRLHRRAANRRRDAIHKFTRKIVDQYEFIVVGDVSSPKLARTRMAKSVLDAGWGMLRTQLQYKGKHAGRSVRVVSEKNTSRACSRCGALTGPSGLGMLVVRRWVCAECGALHDRDANAARNILAVGLRCRGGSPGKYPGSGERASVSGNEPKAQSRPSSQTSPSRRDRIRRGHASGMNTGKHTPPSREEIPPVLKELRQQSGLSQAAKLCLSTLKEWREWESGGERMHPEIFRTFLRALVEHHGWPASAAKTAARSKQRRP